MESSTIRPALTATSPAASATTRGSGRSPSSTPFSLEPIGDGIEFDMHDGVSRELLDRELDIQREMGATIAGVDG